MSNPAPPVIIGTNTITHALADSVFMERVPEFRTLQNKLTTMRVDLKAKRGCSSCRKRRVARNMYNDFVGVILSLSPEALGRFKRYLNTDKIMINTVNTKTNQTEPRVL